MGTKPEMANNLVGPVGALLTHHSPRRWSVVQLHLQPQQTPTTSNWNSLFHTRFSVIAAFAEIDYSGTAAPITAGPATMVSPGFAFVPMNSSGKTQPIDRKTIRSHCMRGKNRRIGVPRRSTTRPTRTLHSLRPVLLDCPSSTITIPCAYQEAEEEDDLFVKARSQRIASFCAPSNIAQVKLAIDMDDTTKAIVIDCKNVLATPNR